MATTAVCHGCHVEKEVSAMGVCAECAEAAKRIIEPRIQEVVDAVREHPIGRKVIEIFEDYAVGHQARRNKGEPKP